MEKKKENKKEGLFSGLTNGSWIDNMSGSWGKPKSFNPDWNKDPREAEVKAETKAKKKVVINGKTYIEAD